MALPPSPHTHHPRGHMLRTFHASSSTSLSPGSTLRSLHSFSTPVAVRWGSSSSSSHKREGGKRGRQEGVGTPADSPLGNGFTEADDQTVRCVGTAGGGHPVPHCTTQAHTNTHSPTGRRRLDLATPPPPRHAPSGPITSSVLEGSRYASNSASRSLAPACSRGEAGKGIVGGTGGRA